MLNAKKGLKKLKFFVFQKGEINIKLLKQKQFHYEITIYFNPSTLTFYVQSWNISSGRKPAFKIELYDTLQ